MPKKAATKAVKAVSGKVRIHATYKSDNTGEILLHDSDDTIEVRAFPEGVVPGSVWFNVEKTYQIKQFEPMKISVGCSLPCVPEEADAALKAAKKIAQDTFMPSVETIRGAMRAKGLL